MAHTRKSRLHERRSLALGLVRRILQRVESGDLDAYEGYRQVQAIYLDDSGLLEDLKSSFLDIPGMPSKEQSNVDQAFREQVIAAAKEWLVQHPSELAMPVRWKLPGR